jgi:rod shape-determining protein MreC
MIKLSSSNRLILVVCCLLAIFLVIANVRDNKMANLLRGRVMDLSSSIFKSVSSILYISRDYFDNIYNIFAKASLIKELETKNQELEQYFYLYKQLEIENKQLKLMLNFNQSIKYKYLTAQIIARSNSNLKQEIIIDAGTEQNVIKWQMVLANNQLIGRVVQVDSKTSRVLLINDPLSHIPVEGLTSNTKLIASGQMTNHLKCQYLQEHNSLQEGEFVVTSPSYEGLAPDVMVGMIVKNGNSCFVHPNIDLQKIKYIHILQIQ